MDLLNSIVAGLSNLGQTSPDLIYSRAGLISWFYKFYVSFHLSIALVKTLLLYTVMNLKLPAEFLEFFGENFCQHQTIFSLEAYTL